MSRGSLREMKVRVVAAAKDNHQMLRFRRYFLSTLLGTEKLTQKGTASPRMGARPAESAWFRRPLAHGTSLVEVVAEVHGGTNAAPCFECLGNDGANPW